MINKILKIIVIILSIIFFIYGLMIKGVGSGTKFYLVWIILRTFASTNSLQRLSRTISKANSFYN